MIRHPSAPATPHAYAPPAPEQLPSHALLALEGADLRPVDGPAGVGTALDALALWARMYGAAPEDVMAIEEAVGELYAAARPLDAAVAHGGPEAHIAAWLELLRDRVGAVTARLGGPGAPGAH